MQKRYIKKIILLMALLCAIQVGCTSVKKSDNNSVTGTIGEGVPIRRLQVAKMLALSAYDIDTIEGMERKIVFEDTSEDKPYDKYINAAYTAGLISGADETHFEPEEYLSIEQAQFLLNKIDKTGTLKLQYDREDRKKPIAQAMWIEVYERAMELNDNTALVSCSFIPYASSDNCSELGDRFIMTDRGLLSKECCETEDYTDCTVSAIIRDKEIVAYKSVENTEPSVMGAVVTSCDSTGATFDMGGLERYFYCDGKSLKEGERVSFKYSGDKITELEKTLGDAYIN